MAGGVLVAAVLESVLEGFTTNNIVLKGPALYLWWDIEEEGIFTEVEGAIIVVVVLWPETVSTIIAHVHDL